MIFSTEKDFLILFELPKTVGHNQTYLAITVSLSYSCTGLNTVLVCVCLMLSRYLTDWWVRVITARHTPLLTNIPARVRRLVTPPTPGPLSTLHSLQQLGTTCQVLLIDGQTDSWLCKFCLRAWTNISGLS